jgi:hypothetical protein
MALSFGVGDYVEGGVLTAVIVLNVSIGFFQEFKAEKKMDSLRALSSPSASVLRDGKNEIIPRYEQHKDSSRIRLIVNSYDVVRRWFPVTLLS